MSEGRRVLSGLLCSWALIPGLRAPWLGPNRLPKFPPPPAVAQWWEFQNVNSGEISSSPQHERESGSEEEHEPGSGGLVGWVWGEPGEGRHYRGQDGKERHPLYTPPQTGFPGVAARRRALNCGDTMELTALSPGVTVGVSVGPAGLRDT